MSGSPVLKVAEVQKSKLAKIRMVITLLLFLMFALWVVVNRKADDLRLNYLPEALRSAQIALKVENSSTVANVNRESRFIVYAMPDELAVAIQERGLGFLNDSNAELVNPLWRKTPVVIDDQWPATADGAPKIEDILGRFGQAIEVESDVLSLVNQQLISDGNYYALRDGVLLIVPSQKVIVYAQAN